MATIESPHYLGHGAKPNMDSSLEKWLTEYEQAGEEARYRDQILHNSYYLLVIIIAATIGSALSLLISDKQIAITGAIILSFFFSFAYGFLATVIHIYSEKRWVAIYRMQEVGSAIGELDVQQGLHPNFLDTQGFSSVLDVPRELRSLENLQGPHLISIFVVAMGGGWLSLAIVLSFLYYTNTSLHLNLIIAAILGLTYFGVGIKILSEIHPTRAKCLNQMSEPNIG